MMYMLLQKNSKKEDSIIKREVFIQIIKLRSVWKIDRRKGDYQLPGGTMLSGYVRQLVESQMEIDNLAVTKNGDLFSFTGGTWSEKKKDFENLQIMKPFGENEACSYDTQERRVKNLVSEIVG